MTKNLNAQVLSHLGIGILNLFRISDFNIRIFLERDFSSSNGWSLEMEKSMIVSTVRMTIPPRKCAEALKILSSIAEQCRNYHGCICCHIYEDLQEKNVLMLEVLWKANEDLKLHIRSDEYRNLLMVLGMALKQPEIRFDTIAHSTGIETVEKARIHAR
jgi:quinol monooxygenase YgiN